MESMTFLEGIGVSLISIFVVFLILFGLYVVISLFKLLFKEEIPVPEKTAPVIQNIGVEDEESKNVAMLMALILANDNNNNKTYEIVSIENKN